MIVKYIYSLFLFFISLEVLTESIMLKQTKETSIRTYQEFIKTIQESHGNAILAMKVQKSKAKK